MTCLARKLTTKRRRAVAQIAVTIKMIPSLTLAPALAPVPTMMMMMMMMTTTMNQTAVPMIVNLTTLATMTPHQTVALHQKVDLAVVLTQTLPIALTATRQAPIAMAPLQRNLWLYQHQLQLLSQILRDQLSKSQSRLQMPRKRRRRLLARRKRPPRKRRLSRSKTW